MNRVRLIFVWLTRAEPNMNKKGAEPARSTYLLPPLTLPFLLHGPALLFSLSLVYSTSFLQLTSIFVMSAPEAVAAPVATVEEVKPTEAVPAPESSVPAAEVPKPEEVAPSPEATKTEPVEAEPTPAEAKKEDHPRSPGLLAKILAPFKSVEKKVKAPKSPKKEKKEEVKPESAALEEPAKIAEPPATEETPVEVVTETAPPAVEVTASEPPLPRRPLLLLRNRSLRFLLPLPW
ncbi:hypothetical protein EDB87DRAFT_178494 [Lactarius vividus]|nr:hypothetical protein EDB87DRAFT_178494 [Lactarius vividus]